MTWGSKIFSYKRYKDLTCVSRSLLIRPLKKLFTFISNKCWIENENSAWTFSQFWMLAMSSSAVNSENIRALSSAGQQRLMLAICLLQVLNTAGSTGNHIFGRRCLRYPDLMN